MSNLMLDAERVLCDMAVSRPGPESWDAARRVAAAWLGEHVGYPADSGIGGLRAILDGWAAAGRGATCGKYAAPHPDTVRDVIGRLDELAPDLADWGRWMVWWHVHQQQQVTTREGWVAKALDR